MLPASFVMQNQIVPRQPRPTIFTSTALTFLKPRFKRFLRPVAAHLARADVTANQVTVTSLVGSLLVCALIGRFADNPASFALLPIWLVARMACATINGVLAIEHGQKSRFGGVLNEVGDIVSDIALPLPLALVEPFSFGPVLLVISLAVLCEFVGIAGETVTGERRLEGPLGKADRSIVLAALGIAIVAFGRLPAEAVILLPVLAAGLLLTIWNRLYCILTAARRHTGEA